MKELSNRDYIKYRDILKTERFPLAFVDIDRFDRNMEFVASTQADSGKTVRVHSKSIRCLALTKRILEKGGGRYKGIMTFSAEETQYLAGAGLDDFIIAYPTLQTSDMAVLAKLTRKGVQVSLMVDSREQLAVLSRAGEEANVVLKACLEIDMAYQPFKSGLYLGVRRSPIRTPEQVLAIVKDARKFPGVTIDSVMGYEAHIAGPNDDVPQKWLKNRVIRGIKKASIREFSKRRKAIVDLLRDNGVDVRVVNGGGSGSLISTGREECVTEVTAGSAFYGPGLFHHYKEVRFEPSAYFAVQVVRKPGPNKITCQGGGYTASGSAGPDKLPYPTLPTGMRLLPMEGAGEVQTPLFLPATAPRLRLGDPVFFQHAKGGELCERFNELYLIRGGRIIDKVKTYRGDGHAFI